MNWNDLSYVLAIAREGNLSRAAATLSVTHTTVSRRLQRCEDQLGVRLFDRTPDGFLPTAAGEDVIATAERMETEALSVERRVMGRDAELRGPLYFSTIDFLYPLLHDALSVFLERYPRVELTITTPLDPVSLRHREADVVLRISDAPPEGLIGWRVGQMDCAAYASPALVARVGADRPLKDYPWLSMDRRLNQPHFDRWLQQNAPGARILARIDENALLTRRMVTMGLAVSFFPVFEAELLGLTAVSPILKEFTTDLWLLTMPELRQTSRVRAFLDHMAPALRERLRPDG